MTNLKLDARGVLMPCPSCGKSNRLVYSSLKATPRCGSCHTPLPRPNAPIEVPDAATFAALVSTSAIPVVVDFWAPWCGPCRMMAPELDKVATAKAGEWLMVKVNTEALPDVGEQFRIRSIPTIAVFREGREISREAGARPASQIQELVSARLAA